MLPAVAPPHLPNLPRPSRLGTAYLLSILLHTLVLGAEYWQRPAAPPPEIATPRLELRLRTPAPALLKNTLSEPEAELTPPAPPPPPPSAPTSHRHSPANVPAKQLTPKPPEKPARAAIERAQRQLSQHLYYPEAAIAQGLEGEVRLLLVLAADGEITDVDLAASSGHRLLDQAAIRAAWAMGQLSGDGRASRELLLPVIFRLQ